MMECFIFYRMWPPQFKFFYGNMLQSEMRPGWQSVLIKHQTSEKDKYHFGSICIFFMIK